MLKSLKKCLKIARKSGFLSNSSGHINIFCQIMYFLPKINSLLMKRVALIMFTKLKTEKEMADKGGRGGLDPPFLADIICEQPLKCSVVKKAYGAIIRPF